MECGLGLSHFAAYGTQATFRHIYRLLLATKSVSCSCSSQFQVLATLISAATLCPDYSTAWVAILSVSLILTEQLRVSTIK